MTVLNGHLDAILNYYEPNKLLSIESCGDGESSSGQQWDTKSFTRFFSECHVLIQEDEARNEGVVEGLDSPVDVEFPFNSSYTTGKLSAKPNKTGFITTLR